MFHKLEKNHCSKKSTDKQIHELKKFMSSKKVRRIQKRLQFEKRSQVGKNHGIWKKFTNLERLIDFDKEYMNLNIFIDFQINK